MNDRFYNEGREASNCVKTWNSGCVNKPYDILEWLSALVRKIEKQKKKGNFVVCLTGEKKPQASSLFP